MTSLLMFPGVAANDISGHFFWYFEMNELIVEVILGLFVAIQAYRNHKAHRRHKDRHEELRSQLTAIRGSSGPSSDENESPLFNEGRPMPTPSLSRGPGRSRA